MDSDTSALLDVSLVLTSCVCVGNAEHVVTNIKVCACFSSLETSAKTSSDRQIIALFFSASLTMLERAIAKGRLSVRPSVCLSVTLVSHASTVQIIEV